MQSAKRCMVMALAENASPEKIEKALKRRYQGTMCLVSLVQAPASQDDVGGVNIIIFNHIISSLLLVEAPCLSKPCLNFDAASGFDRTPREITQKRQKNGMGWP